VQRIVTVGTDLPNARKSLAIAARHPSVYAAFAVHPHDAKDADERTYEQLAELARSPKVVAYGEIGLDFYKNYSPRDVQIAAFRRQIRLARELGLPLIIHDRQAHDEVLAILREEGDHYRGVFHCFAGDEKFAVQVLALGFHLSFTGNITYGEKLKAHRVIRGAPLDRLLIETDAPFLTPEPYRREKRDNEPAYVRRVAETFARLLDLPVDEVAAQTSTNAYRLFRFEHFGRRGEIVYEYKQALYINLTSRCNNRCTFCEKMPDYRLGDVYQYLDPDEEPSVDEVLAAIPEPARYPEIVFCGFGEPTLRWSDLLVIARELKRRGAKRIRLNTNGLGSLVHRRSIAPDMYGVLDAVSVSLNAPDADSYNTLCRPSAGSVAFPAILAFIKEVKQYVPDVTVSAVRGTAVDLAATQHLAEDQLGVRFRLRG
jgi:TatD DNase family protein